MGKPYVYKIQNKFGEFYFGVRWDYSGEPEEDILINYFTSSSLIKELLIKNGVDYFDAEIIKTFDNKKDALNFEYSLIKENIEDKKCLNRALGKCTIWDEKLKTQVSNSVKKLFNNPDYVEMRRELSRGSKNHNFGRKPWRNVRSNIHCWMLALQIYQDYVVENWDFRKYGYGRHFLMKRYNIVQGTSRKIITLLKNNWNPFLDKDYLLFLKENGFVAK